MSLKELKLIFPKFSDAPNPSDRDAYFLFALAALWRDLRNQEREIWWSVLVREECGEVLQLLAGLRLQRSFRCIAHQREHQRQQLEQQRQNNAQSAQMLAMMQKVLHKIG